VDTEELLKEILKCLQSIENRLIRLEAKDKVRQEHQTLEKLRESFSKKEG